METHDWNTATVKELVLTILAEHRIAHDAAHAAGERALDAAFAAQQASVSSAFSAQKAAVEAALASQERQSTAINDAQDKRLDGMKEFFLAIIASHADAHEEAHAADSRALSAALQSQKEANFQALASSKEAVQKAEASSERRFESVNEFRSALSDQQRNLMPRTEVAAVMQAMQDKIDGLTHRLDRGDGRGSGLQAGWGYLIGAVGLAGVIISIVITLAR